METTELTKIDPKEYGLEASKVKEIEQAFTPKIVERDALTKIYEQLITKEVDRDLCNEAGDLRRKLVKVRTGISSIHKTQKAFSLSYGKFVDAWKNKETLPVSQMEEKLYEIEKHYENIEKERLEKIQNKRLEELSKYCEPFPGQDLSSMAEDVWGAYISVKKKEYTDLLAAELKVEKDRAEEEKAIELKKSRTLELAPYTMFIRDIDTLLNKNVKEYNKEVKELKIAYKQHNDRQEEIRLENEKLKKQADEREKLAKIEENRREEAEKKRKDAEAKIQAKKEADQARALKIEQDKLKKIQEELDAKVEAELKATEDKVAKEQAELNKGDVDKVKDLINDLEALKTKYTFKSANNKKMYSSVIILLGKVITYINK